MMADLNERPDVFLRDVPATLQKICQILDLQSGQNSWQRLAGLLGFSTNEIALFQLSMQRPGGSPTDEMLTTWDHENHTIQELYQKLFEMKHVRCMELLKDLVDPSLHCQIGEARGNSQPQTQDQGSAYQPAAPYHPQAAHQPPPNIPLPSHNHGKVKPQDKGSTYQPAPPYHPQAAQHQAAPNIPLPSHNHENNFGRSYSPQPQMQQQPYSPSHQQPLPHQPQRNIPPTAVYPHNNSPLPLPPVDRSKMTAPIVNSGSTTSNNMSPLPSHNHHHHLYQPLPQQNGKHPSRQPSEHPLGGPDRYVSQCSKRDDFALPPVPSPESLSSCRQPVFQPASAPSGQADSVEQYLSSTIEVPFAELVQATNNFSDANKLGEGSFGTVYRGQLNMTDVAIKLIKKNDNVFYDQSKIRRDQIKEILALTKYRHPNIVSLTSYSSDGENLCLILAYMSNGSLESNLEWKTPQSKHRPLSWKQRLNIAEGAANGIHYLHTAQTPPLIHQDIKSANILLDEHFEAQIADFGLARPGPTDGKDYTIIKTNVVFGTKAYLAPEFRTDLKRKLSTRLDVYSFGVVLMEIVTGTKAGASKDRLKVHQLLTTCVDKILYDHEQCPMRAVELLLDPACRDWPYHSVMDVLQLASRCCEDFKRRPEMREVVETLRDIIRRTDENGLGNPSGRNVYPIENTEPMQSREPEESFYRSDSSDGMMREGAMAPAHSPTLFRYQDRTFLNEPRETTKQYRGFEALNEGFQHQRAMGMEDHRKDVDSHVQNLNGMQNTDRHGGYMQPNGYRQHVGGMAGYEAGYPSVTSTPPGAGRYTPGHLTQSTMAPSSMHSFQSHPYYSETGASFDDGWTGGNGAMPPGPGYAYQQQVYDPRVPHPQYQYPPMDRPMVQPGRYQEDNTPYSDMMPPQGGAQPGAGMVRPMPPRGEHYVYYGNPDLQEKGTTPTDDLRLVSDLTPKSTECQQVNRVTSTSSSDQSSSPAPPCRYPKMPTIALGQLSIESSDTSNLTSDTSLRTLSDQGSGLSEGQRSEVCDLKTDNICDSDKKSGAQNGTEVGMTNGIDQETRKEPSQNTDPQHS